MLAGAHFLIGSSIAVLYSKNYLSAFLMGLVSHHLMDRLPHLDLNIFKKDDVLFKDKNPKAWILTISEFILFLLLTFYLLSRFDFTVQKIAVIGGIGGILPDILILIFTRIAFLKKFFSFYITFHKNFHFRLKNKNILFPFLVQTFFILLAILILSKDIGY
jgi:hypothetical protein